MSKKYNNKMIKRDRSKMKTLDCTIEWDKKSITKDGNGNVFIEGFANTSDKDRVQDVILPKAFKETLPEFMDNPVLLFQHDWDMIIGCIVKAEIIEEGERQGLKVKAKISNANDVEDIRTKIKEEIIQTFSIGYDELEAHFDEKTKTNIVSKILLLEISVVSIPCNIKAKFSVVDNEKEEKNHISDDVLTFLSDSLNKLDGSESITPIFLKELLELYKPNRN